MASNTAPFPLPHDCKCPKDQYCPYFMQLQACEYSQEALEHFDTNRHGMIPCQHGKECDAFQRLIGGGYMLDDRCHCAIYKHPSRRDNAHIEKTVGTNKFVSAPLRIVHKAARWRFSNRLCYQKRYVQDTDDSEYLLDKESLMAELRKNGFEWVMQIPNSDTDSSKTTPKNYKTLWDVAAEKMEHPKHRAIKKILSLLEILAILLYTGTVVYRELRHDEMLYWKEFNSDPPKRNWPILSSILSQAIRKLHKYGASARPNVTYHGLHDVVVDPKTFDAASNDRDLSTKLSNVFMYGTFVSTSTDQDIALDYIKSDCLNPTGCLMRMKLKLNSFIRPISICIGADISWLSKFPYESEFLIDKCQGFHLESIQYAMEGYQIADLVELDENYS